ncbi:hypothetical protein BDN72DRAFT_871206 [Pluteus cervinus]|uniref:Uncharacterized protein n=1 Tax=Pluteus cervinus TaxID=181527 RepID=A0ACD3AQG1_9AGAR|nr:hypothetical protein BDN72DRAFT_871206 [Pluteus cervinus]
MATAKSQKTLTEAVKEDHQEMYEYYEEYKRSKGDQDAQARWSRQLIWEVVRHAVGEEIVVYPLMEQKLGKKGLELTDQDRRDHQYAKEKLAYLEGITPGSDEYDGVLEDVMQHLRKHNDSEEQEDLPLLEPQLGTEVSKEAAQSFSRTKKFVPTRAHPWAPNKPPYETLVGFMAMPIDKLKDHFARFPTEEMKEDMKEDMKGHASQ